MYANFTKNGFEHTHNREVTLLARCSKFAVLRVERKRRHPVDWRNPWNIVTYDMALGYSLVRLDAPPRFFTARNPRTNRKWKYRAQVVWHAPADKYWRRTVELMIAMCESLGNFERRRRHA